MKLYEVAWAPTPRRLAIYLAEKSIPGIERIEVPPPADHSQSILAGTTPQGTVPALEIEDGQVIGSSLAIMEYLEERFPSPDLIGASPVERARTREFISVAEELAIHFRTWVFHGSPLFANRGAQSRPTAKVAMDTYFIKLGLLERMATGNNGPFLTGGWPGIADCIAYSVLESAREMFTVPTPDDCPFLKGWYERFSSRPGCTTPEFPQVHELTRDLIEKTVS